METLLKDLEMTKNRGGIKDAKTLLRCWQGTLQESEPAKVYLAYYLKKNGLEDSEAKSV